MKKMKITPDFKKHSLINFIKYLLKFLKKIIFHKEVLKLFFF